MAPRRSIFNNPPPVNPNPEEEQINDEYQSGDQASDLTPSEHDSGSQLPSDHDSEDDAPSDDEEDSDSDDEPHRWGDQEDTQTTIKPYFGVLATLDRDHSTSLSKHLYSAHLIKKRQLLPSAASPTTSDSNSDPDTHPRKRQKSSSQDSEDNDGPLKEKRFITNSWTSWPHPPSYVPRESEHKPGQLRTQPQKIYFDEATYSEPLQKRATPVPSRMLQETLTATFLRISKDSLRTRPLEERKGMVPALDDDLSEHVLRPVVRNVIAKLDALLIGLHHERGYAKTLAMEDGGEEEGKPTKRKPSQYKQTKARRQAKAAARKRGVTPMTDSEDEDSVEELDSGEDEGEGPSKKSKETTHHRRRRPAPPKLAKKYATKRKWRLRLRDWSQVLGIASLTGWDGGALQRTVRRCEGQFDQTMTWRRLKESDYIREAKTGEVWTGARLKRPLQDDDDEGISRDGFMIPIKGIGRKKRAIAKPNPESRKKIKAQKIKMQVQNNAIVSGD